MRNARAEFEVYGESSFIDGFEVITRHPLADETTLLNTLHFRPEDCRYCDLYWLLGSSLFFVSIVDDRTLPALVTYHRNKDERCGGSFYVRGHGPPLETKRVAAILHQLRDWILKSDTLITAASNGRLFEIMNRNLME